MLILKLLHDAQIGALYASGMRRDFPPSELKSLASILKMKHRGMYDVLGAYREDGELAAYALVYRPAIGRAVLLDYLAVEPAYRHAGWAACCLHSCARIMPLLRMCCSSNASGPRLRRTRRRRASGFASTRKPARS